MSRDRHFLPVPLGQRRRRRLWPILTVALVIGIGFGLFLPQRPGEHDVPSAQVSVPAPPPIAGLPSAVPRLPPTPSPAETARPPAGPATPNSATQSSSPGQAGAPPNAVKPPQTAERPVAPTSPGAKPSSSEPAQSSAPRETAQPAPPSEAAKPSSQQAARSPETPPPVTASPSQQQPGANQQAALPPAQPQDTGEPPWRRYAVAAPPIEGRAMVAIIIDDMGWDQKRSRTAMELPGPLTLSFLPYARDLGRQTAEARKLGHELMVHVAMQPISAADPGPNALTVDLPPEEIRRRLVWALGSFDGYVGINNHMGSRFTTDRPGLSVVMEELKSRGLLFLDSRTIQHSLGGDVAVEYGVPTAGRSLFIDNTQTVEEVSKELAEIERIAQRARVAVAIGHPHDVTLAVLKDWLPTLAAKGLVLVPVSAVVARQEARRNPGQAQAPASP